MQVFLVPVGQDQHVPYCEPADHEAAAPEARGGLLGRLSERFRHVIRAAEQSRLRTDVPPPSGWAGRLKARVLRWVADRIAEQRLLWQLRTCHDATLVFPTDITGDAAMALLRGELRRDADRHLRWLIVNAALLVVSGVLALVPGPNLVAYYFAFRVVGHLLSLRGARHGLSAVSWKVEPAEALSDLRAALHLEPAVRHVRVRDIAARLDLPHLATFVERVALKGA
jgi:hypothetical protein